MSEQNGSLRTQDGEAWLDQLAAAFRRGLKAGFMCHDDPIDEYMIGWPSAELVGKPAHLEALRIGAEFGQKLGENDISPDSSAD